MDERSEEHNGSATDAMRERNAETQSHCSGQAVGQQRASGEKNYMLGADS